MEALLPLKSLIVSCRFNITATLYRCAGLHSHYCVLMVVVYLTEEDHPKNVRRSLCHLGVKISLDGLMW